MNLATRFVILAMIFMAGDEPARTDAPAKPPVAQTAKKTAEAAKPTTATIGSIAAPRVKTKAEMSQRSPFLLPPGGPADPRSSAGDASPVEWNDIPYWRKATFFGIRARGQLFVYVVDCSGSMIDDDRLTRAVMELRRSVMALEVPQRFEVIFYNAESIPMPGGPIPRPADLTAKNQLRAWLQIIEPDGGTDPRPALKQAIAMRPDAIFLLSDGAFPDGTVEMVAQLNTRKVVIHCVDLAGGLGGNQLRRIAAANGGQYASRPGSLQESSR